MEFLIVGLGNPGKDYEKTRHNIGHRIVEFFANTCGMKFKQNEKFQGLFARGEIEGKTVNFLLPTTYMNLSGIATRLCQEYYKIDLAHLLIVVDDVETDINKIIGTGIDINQGTTSAVIIFKDRLPGDMNKSQLLDLKEFIDTNYAGQQNSQITINVSELAD